MKKLPKIKKITRNDDGSFTAIDSYGRIYNEVQTSTGNKVTGVTVNGKTITLEYYGDELIKVGDTVVDGLDVIPEPVPTTEDKTVTYTENGNYEVNRSTGKYINKVNVTVNVPSSKEEITYEGTITSNGLYEIDAPEGKVYNKIEATVNVQPPYGELEITENGTYDVKNYNLAMVDVPPVNPYPINIDFKIPNGTIPETYTDYTEVGIKANGKIAEPTTPSVPQGKFFQGWKDGNTTVTFPYAPQTDKTLIADLSNIDFVPYIQSSGSQYIDTLVSSCDGIEIKFAYTAIQNGKYIYGAGDNYTDYRFFTNLYNGNFQVAMGDDSHTFQGISADTNIHTIKSGTNVAGNGAYFDTNNLNIVKGSIASRSLFLFGYHIFTGSSYYNLCSCKIYYAKLYKQGVLVADFVPCRSHESGHDNELCMFDKISETYFYNQGTGEFTTEEGYNE